MLKTTDELVATIEKKIWGKFFLFLGLTTVVCVAVGIGVGVLISEKAGAAQPDTLNAPESMSISFAEIAKQVEPAVVNIDTKSKVPDSAPKPEKPGTSQDDILEFFKRQQRRPSYSVGSGFIVDKSGYILTNFHVIDDAAKISVQMQNGEEYVAKVVGSDEPTDLAILKIEAGKPLPFVKLGDSETAQVGDWVLAIGSPFGLAQTVTAGIISQTNRETPNANAFQRFIQTDAAINRGNSGGPLVNMNGEVIGVNSQIATSTGDYNGIGFALPSREVSYVYQQIVANGKVRRGYLGVAMETLKPEFGKVYEMSNLRGSLITEIRTKDSPAGKAGLQVNDVIVEINGQPVEGQNELVAKVAALEPGKEAKLTYLREINNQLEKLSTTVILGERPSANNRTILPGDDTPKKIGQPQPVPTDDKVLGLKVEEFTNELAKSSNMEGQKGVLIKEIDPTGFIIDIKNSNGRGIVNEGEVIQRINRQTITDLKGFNEIVRKLKVGDAVVLHLAYYNRPTKSVQQKIATFTIQ